MGSNAHYLMNNPAASYGGINTQSNYWVARPKG